MSWWNKYSVEGNRLEFRHQEFVKDPPPRKQKKNIEKMQINADTILLSTWLPFGLSFFLIRSAIKKQTNERKDCYTL